MSLDEACTEFERPRRALARGDRGGRRALAGWVRRYDGSCLVS